MKFVIILSMLSAFALPKTVYCSEILWFERSMGFMDLAAEPLGGDFGATKSDVKLWEEGILPLVFAEDISPEKQARLFEACGHWARAADVKCIQGPYKGRELKVTNDNGQGCWASLGTNTIFVFIKRRMNLADRCWDLPTLIHELGHSLGFTHE